MEVRALELKCFWALGNLEFNRSRPTIAALSGYLAVVFLQLVDKP